MDMTKALDISARGMQAQTTRLRVIAENLANQDTTGSSPEVQPDQRKTVSFRNTLDRASGTSLVSIKQIGRDKSEFPQRYDPGHPAAGPTGYVRTPNVNSMIEVMDMREAQRSYNANLSVMQVARSIISRTIDMLKS